MLTTQILNLSPGLCLRARTGIWENGEEGRGDLYKSRSFLCGRELFPGGTQ